ncbi:MAG: glycosyltransferase family 4 protein [Anaerolineales bacterium]|nr:glycosyltransferase family 4 protein [Anaerolineales bacterium]
MVVHAYYPLGETRVQREAEALVDAGLQVDVICLRQQAASKFQEVSGVNVYRLPVRRRKGIGIGGQLLEYLAFFLMAFWQLSVLHLQRRYNVVQVHNLPDFLVFTTIIPRLTGAKVILDLHDLMPEFYVSRFRGDMDSVPVRLVRLQEQLACRFAQHVITVTEHWRQALIQRGLSPGKCSVVMNLPDDKFFKPVEIENDSSQGDQFNLFYHGILVQRYGIDLALRAVARLRHELPGLRLTIHGTGEFLGELQRLAQDLDLGEHVNFSTNFMPVEHLPAFIARADLGLVLYRRDTFTDGILPTKLMEYAALGIPTIVARTPAISAYFDETMVEFFTAENLDELIERIRELYHNRSRREELSHNIQKFNQNYNWKKQKIAYINLVERLAKSQPGGNCEN